jgi:MFS family permease
MGIAALFLGASMLIASAMPTIELMVIALVVVGAGSVAFITMGSATLQMNAPVDVRGRVMALYVTAIIGTTPIGGPIIGWIGQQFGARATFVTGGMACILTALVAWRSLARVTEPVLSDAEDAAIEKRAVIAAEDAVSDKSSSMPRHISTQEP